MDVLQETINLLFGSDPELRQIIGVTLQMSVTSTLISVGLGIPLGTLIGMYQFRGKGILMRIINTLMGLPPVVAGLLVFFLLSRSGPLGEYKLLYSVTAMVIAQVILITPIATGLTASMISQRYPLLRETALGIACRGANSCSILFMNAAVRYFRFFLPALAALSLRWGQRRSSAAMCSIKPGR